MTTATETPPPSQHDAPSVNPAPTPAATDSTATSTAPLTSSKPDKPPPTAPVTSTAPPTTAADSANTALPDALSAISSMWSGWLSPTTTAQPATTQTQHPETATTQTQHPETATSANGSQDKTLDKPSQPPSTQPQATATAAAAAAATDLFQGAGKMWNDMSATLKDAADNVDTTVLNEQVTVIREKSGRLMEDVSRSVHSLNLSLQSADLSKSAEVISSSTRDLLDKASQSIEQGRKEALEIFVDKTDAQVDEAIPSGVTPAPWDVSALPEGERKYADALRREMLKLVVDSIYSKKKRTALFLSDAARKNGFTFTFSENAREAMAALEADTNMRRLRAGLVPGKMKEDAFWCMYFYHLHRIRQALIANEGVMPDGAGEDDDADDDALLFGDDGEAEELATLENSGPAVREDVMGDSSGNDTPAAPDNGDGERNWEEDIDAAFKDDEE